MVCHVDNGHLQHRKKYLVNTEAFIHASTLKLRELAIGMKIKIMQEICLSTFLV